MHINIKSMKKGFIFILIIIPLVTCAQVDYSVVAVNEESGLNLTPITSDNDGVCMPLIKRRAGKIEWSSDKIIDISVDGKQLAYLSFRNNTSNIFIKDIDKQGSSVQRTNRQSIIDFNYSPDGQYICFTEKSGKFSQIYQTNAKTGYVCRQITNNNKDFAPIYSKDLQLIYFSRQEGKTAGIWSYNIANNFLTSYTTGQNPYPINSQQIICTRINAEGLGEIWRIDFEKGIEECIVNDAFRSFTTPTISPDGEWILMVGSNVIKNGKRQHVNTDIFVCRTDGTQLTQLTYHAADDVSPVWGRDGQYIYFISQRGSVSGKANVWRMSFIH